MNKVYLLFPVIALLLFGGYWWQYSTAYEKRLEEQKVAEVRKREKKAEEDAANREKAIKEAVAASEKRKKEREEKLAKEKAEKEARELAIENRNKARSEQYKLNSQYDRLAKDVAAIKEEVGKLEDQIKNKKAEQDFLKVYVQKAEANVKYLGSISEKVEKSSDAIKKNLNELAALKAKSS